MDRVCVCAHVCVFCLFTQGFKGMNEDALFVFFNLLLERREHACTYKPTEQTEPEKEKRETAFKARSSTTD